MRNKELELKAIELYNSGLSMAKVGKEIGRTSAVVLDILNKYNIPKRTKGGIYKLPATEIIEKYIIDKRTLESIANDYQVTINTIKKVLIDNKISIRTSSESRNPYFNQNAFEEINSEEAAYFLGLLITDGCIFEPDLENNHPNYSISLELQEKDEYILEQLKDWLKLTGPTLYHREKITPIGNISKTSILHWYSTKMANDLKKYGVIPRKTSQTYLPQISKNLMPHLIRGMIDGDGCISIDTTTNRLLISFCGNEKCVNDLKDYLVSNLNVYDVKVLQIGRNLWQVSWSGQKDCYKICDYIYCNATYYLKRKKEKFLQIFKDYENTEVT